MPYFIDVGQKFTDEVMMPVIIKVPNLNFEWSLIVTVT